VNEDKVIKFEPRKEPISDAEFEMFLEALMGPYYGGRINLE
jgi:hypothetical protein